MICKTASKQRAPPKKSQNHLSTQKIVKVLQKLRKSPENTKKSEVNPKQQKISHCKVFQKIPAQKGKFPHNFPHNRANSRTKPPNSRTRAAENCPKTGFWAKFAFLALLVHKHRFSSESVPKRPETAFSDKNCIFCFVSRKLFFFSEFKYFCLAWFWSGFCKFFALENVFAKEQPCFLARLVQQQSVEGSGVILAFDWRNGSRKSLHCMLASVSPEGQF